MGTGVRAILVTLVPQVIQAQEAAGVVVVANIAKDIREHQEVTQEATGVVERQEGQEILMDQHQELQEPPVHLETLGAQETLAIQVRLLADFLKHFRVALVVTQGRLGLVVQGAMEEAGVVVLITHTRGSQTQAVEVPVEEVLGVVLVLLVLLIQILPFGIVGMAVVALGQ